MRGGTHALAGLIVGLLIVSSPDLIPSAAAAAAGALGALAPDLDHPRAALSRRVGPLGLPFRLVKHRGAMHSAAAAGAVAVAALAVTNELQAFALIAAAGYASHIVLDALTITGVPLLWPWSRRFRLLPIRTGGTGEKLVLWLLVGLLAYMYRDFFSQIISIAN